MEVKPVKTRIFRSILVFLLLGNILVAEKSIEQWKPEKTRIALQAAKIVGGIGLGVCGFILTSYPYVFMHEAGHRYGFKVTGGDAHTNIYLYPKTTFQKNPSLIFQPFGGRTKNTGGNHKIGAIGGPLMGTAFLYSTIVGAESLRAYWESKSKKENVRQGLKGPINVYTFLANKAQTIMQGTQQVEHVSFATITFITFSLLQTSKLIAEIIAGFTPIFPNEYGDGLRFWREFNPNVRNIPFDPHTLAIVPSIAAVIVGASKGLYEKYKNTSFIKKIKSLLTHSATNVS